MQSRPMRTTIEGAALVGFVCVLTLAVARLLTRRAPSPSSPADELAAWYADSGHQRSMVVALNLTVIAAIAFLWFIAVVRRRVGERENRFFGTVFLASAALLCVAWVVASCLYTAPALSGYLFGIVPERSDIALWQAAGIAADSVVGARFEAVLIMSTTTVGRLSGAFDRPLVVIGYVLAAGMMVAPLPNDVVIWIFPAWVAVVSAMLLVRRHRLSGPGPGTEPAGAPALP